MKYKIFKKIKNDLNIILKHFDGRTSICDLVDDKTQEEVENIKEIWGLCEKIQNRLEEIYKNI